MESKSIAIENCKKDPLNRERWIELGKAMGWVEQQKKCQARHCVNGTISETPYKCALCSGSGFVVYGKNIWKDHWHRLIDHLAEGKSIESFFEGIK